LKISPKAQQKWEQCSKANGKLSASRRGSFNHCMLTDSNKWQTKKGNEMGRVNARYYRKASKLRCEVPGQLEEWMV
jgi:hypothetical protein